MTMGLNWVLLLAQVVLFHVTTGSEVVVQVNTKKWIHYLPERFLSLTVDPLTLAAASPLTQESFNMAKGLSPSFVRLGGIGTNAVYFGKKFMENSTTVSEDQWDSVNEFAQKTGLDIIASLNPTMQSDGVWDPQNSLELISYSSEKRYGVAWQLGYDMRGYNASGAGVGKDLVKLRKILDGVSSYANSPVFGPDVTSVSGAKQIHFVKDLITNAGSPLACLILRPNFKNDLQPEDPYDLMASMTNELDTYVWNKDVRIGRSTPKKPVWIAEPMASQGSFKEAMTLAKRVGHAARLGVQIYLRQAGTTTLKSPTPDYWFSLLYKTLVGQGVLDYKIISRNQTGLQVFTHCTAAVPQDKSVLDADWNYEKGAVTLFGVNESPEPTKLVFKVSNKEEPIHIYTLTSAKMNSIASNDATTLLNGQELKLSPTSELPVLSPKVKKPSKSGAVTIPGNSIYFVVLPDSKVRTCSVAPLSAPDLNLSELTKRLRLSPQKKSDDSKEDKKEEEEDVKSEERVYVSFTKKRSVKPPKDSEPPAKPDVLGKTLMRTLISKLSPKKIDVKTDADNEEAPVRYITFNENSFLNKLAEGIKEDIEGNTGLRNAPVEYKYPALASAIKSSKTEAISETSGSSESEKSEKSVLKSQKSDTIASVSGVENVQVISIKPLGSSDDGHSLLRSRRSSTEERPGESSSKDSGYPIKMIEDLLEAKKTGTPLGGEMKNVEEELRQHDVTWKLSPEEGSADVHHASREQEFGREKAESDSGSKLRNVRQTGDVKGAQSAKPEEVKAEEDKDVETEMLAKVVEKTEQLSVVSESPAGVVVPEDVPQEKLEDVMLETAKSNSDPEPDGSPSGDSSKPSQSESSTVAEQQAVVTEAVPVLLIPRQQQHIPLINQPAGLRTPLPDQFNPMQIPAQPNPGIGENPLMAPSVQSSNLQPSPQETVALVQPPSGSPNAPPFDEKKENAIDKILKKIASEENAALAKMPTDGLKPGMVEEVRPSEVVPIDVEGHTVFIPPEDLVALKQPDVKSSKSGEGSGNAPQPAGLASSTLVDEKNLDLEREASGLEPSVKVAREIKLRIPLGPVGPTPKAATATLAAPVEEPLPTTPVPVSPLPAPKESKPPAANQIPPLKPPTPEELRERYKVLREKMLELRQQYLEAREKRLEEFRKQVMVARATPEAEGTIKSTIKRREAELKEWFKKFDKRETDSPPGLAKPRPRRLSMFTNDEQLDMEKFFEEEPADSYNFKRSPEIDPPPQQYLPTPEVPTPNKPEVGKILVPLDSKTPQGIVYNNRIYPAILFGYIDPQNSRKLLEPVDGLKSGTYRDYKVTEAEMPQELPVTRERLAYVPKDAFIREFKSDFVPVVLLDPEESGRKAARSRRSLLDSPARLVAGRRSKRSTLTDLEEQFKAVKDEIFPKITSWFKNFRENPPWKRDLQRSSRSRRSVKDFLLTNDLRSLKLPKPLPKPGLKSAPEIEDLVFENIDRSENDVLRAAESVAGLAGKIGPANDPNEDHKIQENGYCEEIGTSGKSVIRDPFAGGSEKAALIDSASGQPESSPSKELKSTLKPMEHPQSTEGNQKTPESQSNDKHGDENGDTAEEVVFATVVADKLRQFFTNIQEFFGSSDR